jgi:hypothetical protein
MRIYAELQRENAAADQCMRSGTPEKAALQIMRPARRLPDRSRMAPSQIEVVVPVKGVGLQDAGIAGQMRLRMLALAVA